MSNNAKIRISWVEAMSILTVSQVFSTIAFSTNELSGFSTILSFTIGTAMNFLIVLPFFVLCKKHGYRSIIDFSSERLGIFSYLVAILALSVLLGVAISTITTFEDHRRLRPPDPDPGHRREPF